jgi:plasmid stabilization system protein ParE
MPHLARGLLDDPLPRKDLERRAAPRYAIALQASFRALAGATGLYWDGTVQDLSAGGVSFRTYRQFPIGTVLILKLHRGSSTISTVVRLVHAKQLEEEGQYLLGGTFATKLSDADLKVLLASGQEAGAV